MVPTITTTPSFPLLLDVNDSACLICMGMGGPRLMLTWDRDGSIVVNGAMGNDMLQYNFTANNNTFGTYNCIGAIDDMEVSESIDVVGTYVCVVSCLCVRCVCV